MSGIAEVKARMARDIAEAEAPGLPPAEQAVVVVDVLIKDGLVGAFERDEWVAKVRVDLDAR